LLCGRLLALGACGTEPSSYDQNVRLPESANLSFSAFRGLLNSDLLPQPALADWDGLFASGGASAGAERSIAGCYRT
jgi:hypothetical protein